MNRDNQPKNSAGRLILKICIGILIGVVLLFLSSLAVVQFYPAAEEMNGVKELAVIFGAGITKEGPSTALQMRLDKGIELYKNSQVKYFFVSGTQYEVRSMKAYLIKHKIPGKSIIEDKLGVTTHETMVNVKSFTEKKKVNGIVFISQKYHIPRIVLFALRTGITNAAFIAAERKEIQLKHLWTYTIREALALARAFILNY
ncbi:MAG: hypothetical protein A2Y33_02155 [Spirochaetes bacterium GWF1_51_8]|nr:MAG: hypothetical protein A2Y33_02155 [Spirochaetes bacterium GWF1_51_8]